MAPFPRNVNRALPLFIEHRAVRPKAHQHPSRVQGAVFGGMMERRESSPVRQIQMCSMSYEKPDRGWLVVPRGPIQGSSPVGIGACVQGIDRSTALEGCPQSDRISLHRRVPQ
jgi:hypothetical protein